VDRLDGVNSAHGRQAGDGVIREVAGLLRDRVRGYDLATRLAGGQFALLLPEVDRDGAAVLAERVRSAVAGRRFDVPSSFEPLRITVSVGAALTEAGPVVALDQLTAEAAAALAQAKREGRDRTRVVGVAAPRAVGGADVPAAGLREESGATRPPAAVAGAVDERGRSTAPVAVAAGAAG
jgi:diguanylate cyclase (GGDEF)-like protein